MVARLLAVLPASSLMLATATGGRLEGATFNSVGSGDNVNNTDVNGAQAPHSFTNG